MLISSSLRLTSMVFKRKRKFSFDSFHRKPLLFIYFLDHYQIHMEDQPSSHDSTQQQATAAVIPCTVCEVPSRGLIYGAIACEACKAFFKRNAEYGLVS